MDPLEPSPAPTPRRWIVSAPIDLSMVALPFLATLVVLALPRPETVSLAAFLLLIVAFDVAHVWSTAYISYLDREAFDRRRLLFLLPIPITVLVGFRLHEHSPALFWTAMAYLAIHHFASQQYGFIALYKLRAGERSAFDRYLDKWTLWVGALGPILWWHTTDRSFDWFGHEEEFLRTFDPALRTDIYAGMALVAFIYVCRQLQLAGRDRFNVPKNLWMLGSWLSWSLGIGMADHPLVGLACINLFHGIPFLILVWQRTSRHWAQRRAEGTAGKAPIVEWLTRPGRVWAFYGVLLLIGIAEEALWEGLVWGNHLPKLTELPDSAISACVAVLATPQIVHYYLDAWLWKLDGSNPDLHVALEIPSR